MPAVSKSPAASAIKMPVSDLVETACVTEAVACCPDDDVNRSELLLHLERLDEQQRLGSNPNRLVVTGRQHQEAAVVSQRFGPAQRRAGRLRRRGHRRCTGPSRMVAGEPREARGNRRRSGFAFGVSRRSKPLECLGQ